MTQIEATQNLVRISLVRWKADCLVVEDEPKRDRKLLLGMIKDTNYTWNSD